MLFLAAAGTLLVATEARADAMTPLLTASFFHLFFGNIILGIVEGTILKVKFHLPDKVPPTSVWALPKPGPIALMIMANYLSAWLGIIVGPLLGYMLGLNITNYQSMRWAVIGGLYLATLLIEWPFVALCFRHQERWFIKSVKASLLVQTITYSVLCLCYGTLTDRAFFKNVAVVPASEITVPGDLAVLYRAESDNVLHSYTFATGVDSSNPDPHLQPYWDKAMEGVQFGPAETLPKLLGPPSGVPGEWHFDMGHWQWGGIWASRKSAQDSVAVNVESPIALWRVRKATYIPTDKVIFEFGPGQICLLDPAAKRIALVAKGTDPVLVRLPSQPTTPKP